MEGILKNTESNLIKAGSTGAVAGMIDFALTGGNMSLNLMGFQIPSSLAMFALAGSSVMLIDTVQEDILPMLGVDSAVIQTAGRLGEPLIVGGILTGLNLGIAFINGGFNSSMLMNPTTYLIPMAMGGVSVFAGDYIESSLDPIL